MIRRYRPWTPEDENLLRALVESGASVTLVAAKLNRSITAIQVRAKLMSLPFRKIRLKAKEK
jgi:hypothetical protein